MYWIRVLFAFLNGIKWNFNEISLFSEEHAIGLKLYKKLFFVSWMLLKEVINSLPLDVSKNKMDLHVSGMITSLPCSEVEDGPNDFPNPVIMRWQNKFTVIYSKSMPLASYFLKVSGWFVVEKRTLAMQSEHLRSGCSSLCLTWANTPKFPHLQSLANNGSCLKGMPWVKCA